MEKKDFKVGQKVYLRIKENSNAARHVKNTANPEDWILEKIVISIGRKYITVGNDPKQTNWSWNEKFSIDNNFYHCHEYGGAEYELYLTKKDALDDLIKKELFRKIKNIFSSSLTNHKTYTIEQLQKITEILDIQK